MSEPTTNHPTDRATDPTGQPAVDADLAAAVRYTGRLRLGFYVVVLLVALAGQVTGAVERLKLPMLVALLAVGALELGGMVVLSNADVRRRLGERAIGSRLLSAAIAGFAVTFNWLCHADHLLGGFYAGMSALGYLVWLMSTENNRRDRLRTTGDLSAVAPAYPLVMWVRHPFITRRARDLAKADAALGLYGSIAAATAARRAERRQAAIARVLRREIAASADPTAAEIAVTVFDLEEIARRLAVAADYDGLTALVASKLDPTKLLTNHPSPVDQSPVPTTNRPNTDTPASTDHAPRPARPTTARPTAPRTALMVVGEPAAVANARRLRDLFRTGLPMTAGRISERKVREATGWSKVRAEHAIRAYQAGADLATVREQSTPGAEPADGDRGDEERRAAELVEVGA